MFLAAMSSVYPPFLFLTSSSGSVLPATEVTSGLPSLFVHHLSVSLTPHRSEIRGSVAAEDARAGGGGSETRGSIESFLVVPARLYGYSRLLYLVVPSRLFCMTAKAHA